jgi:two-component system, NarL family, nitrate/nitrite response regulator NarL
MGPEMANGEQTSGPILIADADETFVGSLQTLLESVGYRTLAAGTGEEALKVAREERPLVVLLDIHLPLVNGYEVCRALRDEFGRTVAIAFVSGTRIEPVDISSGLLVGADNHLVKPFDSSELLARVGALMRRVTAEDAIAISNPASLTSRELEILRLLANGFDQTDIAQRLSISPRTVGAHIEHILGKLGVHSRAQAVAAAYRGHLVGASRKSPTG